jgi:outer membrane protein
MVRSAAYAKALINVESAGLSLKMQKYDGATSISASASGAFDYNAQASGGDGPGASLRLGASQIVFDGGRQSALLQSPTLVVRVAEEELRAIRVDLVGKADTACYAVLKAQASADAAVADLEAATLRLDLAQAKSEAGMIARSDYLQAEAEVAGYGTSVIKARKTLASARAAFASLAGTNVSIPVKAVEFAAYEPMLARLAALDEAGAATLAAKVVAVAKAGSPALALYGIAVQSAEAELKVARSAYAPTVEANLSHALSWTEDTDLTLGTGSMSLTATVSLDFWKTANSVALAALSSSSATVDEAETTRALALDIEVAVNELLGAARSIFSSEKAVEYAQSNYRNVLERYTLSSASAADLSAALALVSTSRSALISARYDFLSYLSSLRGLAGLEREDALVAMMR